MGIRIIRRTEKASGRRDIFVLPPTQAAILHVIILDPDLTQELNRWDLSEQRWSSGIEKVFQQGGTIPANRFCQGLTLRMADV
jgi:hypothetical protein